MRRVFAAVAVALICASALAANAAADSYMTPPAPIAQILDAPPTPGVSVSPKHDTIAILASANLPPIAELAEPDLRLAGFRINPRNNGPANSRLVWLNGLTFQDIATGAARPVALPKGTRFFSPSWSPDGARLAFLADAPRGLELWVAEAATGKLKRLTGAQISAPSGDGFQWLPDSSGLLVRLVTTERGAVPVAPGVPSGPVVQQSAGRTAPVRTYQDLLRNPYDEQLFAYYFTAQLAVVPVGGGAPRLVGKPDLILSYAASPDGRYVVRYAVKRPFSYVVPAFLFPATITVTDLGGTVVRQIADLPLRDDIPPQFDAVAPGPRDVDWRNDKPATLVWVEAQDGGDVKRAADIRDRVFMLDAPFTGEPRALVDLKERFSDIDWGRDDLAIVNTRWFNTRHETRVAVDPSKPGGTGRVLIERNYQDRYNDPGTPVYKTTAQGRSVMHFTPDGGGIFLQGNGATAEGEFPFLSQLDLRTGASVKQWQARLPYFERVVTPLDDRAEVLLTRRESRTDPPNYFVRPRSGEARQITFFPDRAPQFAGVTQKLITYKRADGVALSGTLYLPAGYDAKRDGRLPLLMWAYPTEFTDAAVAGQVVDTQNRFVRPGGISHLFMLTQGYAVLDNPKMPIVGEKGVEPNDTYVEQLVASAKAAVDAVVDLGIADRDRIAIGGHSYGAFMTANLLAHTDLFRAGIARSGAYNRTLTPFGFQAEQRTYWEATDTYTKMSPFTHAPKIKEPILLIHGEADDNSGTFPIQSERLYAALKGNGATVRYVVLPLEAHGYRGRESVLHTEWEMVRWLDTYVKNAPARQAQN